MLEKIVRRTIICGIFAVPFIALVIDQSMFFPAITAKNFAFRIIVEIIAGLWLALALVHKKYRPQHSMILEAFTFLLVIIAIANLFGVDPYRSFWGNYQRMDGWITILHVYLYFIISTIFITNNKLWKLLFQVSLGVSVVVAIYGFLQIFGIIPLAAGGQSGLSVRIDATLGNPIYLAVYMLFHIFIAVLLWYQAWKEQLSGRRLAPSLIYFTIIVLDLATLLFTGTRGTILGLIGGTALTLIILAFAHKSHRLRMVAAVSVIAIVILGGCLSLAKDTSVVRSIGFINRLASISSHDSTIQTRLINIDIAWQGVKEHPIFGWGQENFIIVFQKYYDPRMYNRELWQDRVHNIFFDWLISGGILGLIAYLSIFLATLWTIWMRNIFSISEKSVLTGLLATYTINNLAVFDTITSYILFASILAYIVFREHEKQPRIALSPGVVIPDKSLPVVVSVIVPVIIGVVWLINGNAFVASHLLIQAHSTQDDLTKNLEYYRQAISRGSYGTQEARILLSEDAQTLQKMQLVPNEIKKHFFDLANSEMKLELEVAPIDARIPFFYGRLLDAYGDYTNAEILLKRAHELAPKMQAILFDVTINAGARRDVVQSLAYAKENYDLERSNTQAAQLYVAVLQGVAESNPSMKPEYDMLIQQILNEIRDNTR